MKTLGLSSLVTLLCLVSFSAQAEDIDLFTGVNPEGGNLPTVLLYMHNTRNSNASVVHGCTYNEPGGGAPALGNTVGGMEQCAMVNALLSLKDNPALLGGVRVGVLVFNNAQFSSFNNGSASIGNGAGECGYLAYVPTVMDSDGIDAIVSSIKSYSGNNYLVPNRAVGDGMASAWAALNGLTDSCGGNNINYSALAEVATACRDAVLVYIGNLTKQTAKAEDDPSGKPRVENLLKSQLTTAFGYSENSQEYQLFTSPISVTGLNDNSGVYHGVNWARFMKRVNVDDSSQSDRNITTYTVGVYDPDLLGTLSDQVNYLAEMAKQGGGKAFTVQASQSQQFEEILIQIFTEVQAVNSVFSSATLPVSANAQDQFLNQVFVALFRPDAQAGPRWFGNVKQYQLGVDSGGNVVLADATQNTANATDIINPSTGLITDGATSFWTTNDPTPGSSAEWPDEGYWVNSPDGDGLNFDAPDGNLVEKGGAAQMVRIDNVSDQSARKVYTCANVGSCGAGVAGGDFVELTEANFAASGDALFGLSDDGAGATTIDVGSIVELGVSYQCTDIKNGPQVEISCGFTVSSGDLPALSLGSGNGRNAIPADLIHIESSDFNQTDCSVSAPCALTNKSDTSFTVRLDSMGEVSGSASIKFYHYSTTATVQQPGHGYNAGEEVELAECQINGSEAVNYNLGQIATASGTYLTEVATAYADAYTIVLESPALGSEQLSCGSGSSALTVDNLIAWMRGEDVANNEVLDGPCPLNSDGSRTNIAGAACSFNVRPSVHGDVLHSRPLVINYGDIDGDNSDDEQDVVVFYGSNDGMFRAINGNQSRSINGVRAGGELWSFVAPEFFPKFKRLFNDDPKIAYPGIGDLFGAERRDYFFDGSTGFLRDLRAAGESTTGGKTYIYLSARRGGRFVYAMDVSDPTTPQFLWSKSNSAIPELGQTWSRPVVTQVEGHSNPVLVFGAGYDPAEDADPVPATGSITMGRGIIILDAVDGSLVWAALPSCAGVTGATDTNCVANTDLQRSFAADIRLVDNDFDGQTDRLYAADTGGNVWRVDLQPGGNSAPENWAISRFATLGGTGNNARKFFYPPAVVVTKTGDPNFVAVASGDREKPLYTSSTTEGLAYNVENRFYMLVDSSTGDSVPNDWVPLVETDLINKTGTVCLNASSVPVACTYNSESDTYVDSGGTTVDFTDLPTIVAASDGFFITMEGDTANNGDSEGEKGVNAVLADGGVFYFATNQPDTPEEGACSANLGIARGYKVDFFTGKTEVSLFAGGGMPPSALSAVVVVNGQTRRITLGTEGSPVKPKDAGESPGTRRQRTYWYYN